jgi:hypothetical protein
MVDRAAYSSKWPLWEFWKDKVKPHRTIADEYIEPILNAALEKKKAGQQYEGKGDEEAATFLSDLVKATDSASHHFFNSAY